jgi:phage protein U
MLFFQGKGQKRQLKFLRGRAAKGRPAFAIRGFGRAISSLHVAIKRLKQRKENTMTNAAHTAGAPEMLDALLDAKRYLEKAQNEVDHGDNDVEKVSCYVNAALASIMKGLTMGR